MGSVLLGGVGGMVHLCDHCTSINTVQQDASTA